MPVVPMVVCPQAKTMSFVMLSLNNNESRLLALLHRLQNDVLVRFASEAYQLTWTDKRSKLRGLVLYRLLQRGIVAL